MKTKKKTWFRKLNHSVLKKKTPLLGFTVLQVFILFLVMSGGGAAVILSRQQQPMQNTGTTPTYNTDTVGTAPPINTAPQDSTKKSSSTQQKTNSTTSSSSSGGHLDQWGCYVPTTTISADVQSYSQCVSNAKTLWCNTHISAPSSTFNSATLQARAAYSSVMNEWQSAQYLPTHSPYSEYLTDATSKFNAIYQPAFTAYTNTVESLNQQNCSIKYPTAESAGQYW